ncbi:MAG: hypothetical protein ABWZ25_10945 [Chitinophagaceae bacterium]
MQTFLPNRRLLSLLSISLFCLGIFYSCSKSDNNGSFDVNNSLTLFKLDNNNNSLDLTTADTVASQSGVQGKYILVSGATGASKGLETIRLKLMTTGDSLLTEVIISSFFKPEYHVINTQLLIPVAARGMAYKISVEVLDKAGEMVGTGNFFGLDVLTCDPLPPCLVTNQITVMVQTPPGTPDETLYLFGSLNGWNRGDVAFQLHKNPDVPNCYCVTIPYPPGYSDWQVNEVYVTRGLYENDAVTTGGDSFIAAYNTTEMGPLWKITVPKWRDQ